MEQNIQYLIDNEKVQTERFVTADKTIEPNVDAQLMRLAFAFNSVGKVEYVLSWFAHVDSGSNRVYVARYEGSGRIGEPEVLVNSGRLFGVLPRIH